MAESVFQAGYDQQVEDGYTGNIGQYIRGIFEIYKLDQLRDGNIACSLELFMDMHECGVNPAVLHDENKMRAHLLKVKQMQELSEMVSALNPDFPGIGAGMLRTLVAKACAIVDGIA